MTPEEALRGVMKLQASYPTMTKLGEESLKAYAQEIGLLRWEDFAAGATVVVRTSKFFPSIAELLSAAEDACRKRLAAKDHEEREERLAIQAGEAKIMDPKSEVHRVVVGPQHQRFLDILSGKVPLPAPSWEIKPRAKGEAA